MVNRFSTTYITVAKTKAVLSWSFNSARLGLAPNFSVLTYDLVCIWVYLAGAGVRLQIGFSFPKESYRRTFAH